MLLCKSNHFNHFIMNNLPVKMQKPLLVRNITFTNMCIINITFYQQDLCAKTETNTHYNFKAKYRT